MAVRLSIADFRFTLSGRRLESYILRMPFFAPFIAGEGGEDFQIVSDLDGQSGGESTAGTSFFDVSFEKIDCSFHRSGDEIWFRMHDGDSGMVLYENWTVGSPVLHITDGPYSPSMYRFALWTAVNLLLHSSSCLALHSSANVFPLRAGGYGVVICLGESGTGKSTHTRLQRERFPESFLLNDDSPFVRIFPDGRTVVYGSPWSGKTPCYKSESYSLKAVIRLSQAPFNRITRLGAVSSIAALLPSVPPVMNHIEECADTVCDYISGIVGSVPLWHLECLPDIAAAELSVTSVFGSGEPASDGGPTLSSGK